MVRRLDHDDLGRRPAGNSRGDGVRRAVLVVTWHQQVDGTTVVRSGRRRGQHGQRGSDGHPAGDPWISDAEAHGSAEGVADQPDRSVGRAGDHVERSDDVEALLVAARMRPVGLAAAAEVEAHVHHPDAGEAAGEVGQQRMVSVAPVERVWVAQHCATARSGRGSRHRQVSRESHAVEGVQVECVRFDRHGPDGTLAAVADTEKLPIKMLNDRLLVRIPEKEGERRSSGGILIPATAQVSKRLVWADVVAYGQNVRSVEIGDRVLFSPEDRYEVEVGGDDYIMLRERDIHAVAAKRVEGSTGLYL